MDSGILMGQGDLGSSQRKSTESRSQLESQCLLCSPLQVHLWSGQLGAWSDLRGDLQETASDLLAWTRPFALTWASRKGAGVLNY